MRERTVDTSHAQEVPLSYLEQFEDRLARLQPYPDAYTIARRFDTDLIGLYPEKFTSTILWRNGQEFEILLGSETRSGYRQMDHDKILNEYGMTFDIYDTWLSFLVTSGSKRFLITNGLDVLKDDEFDVLKATLEKYGIVVAFSTDMKHSLTDPYALRDDEDSSIAIGNYTDAIDALLYDDWTRQIAVTYGLTVREWLRFRVAKELPADRKPLR